MQHKSFDHASVSNSEARYYPELCRFFWRLRTIIPEKAIAVAGFRAND
jgi:hypothetical protein